MVILTPPAAPRKANRTRSTRSRSRSSLDGNMVHDGSGQGTHYCSKDEKPIYADADAGVYSTAALVVQAVKWWLVANEGFCWWCLVS